MKPPGRAITRSQRAFLAAYTATANMTQAAVASGVSRSAHFEWMKNVPEYPALFAAADALATQALLDSAVDRAMRGVFEPNVFKGEFIYPQEEYVFREAQPAREAVFGVDAVPAVPAEIRLRDVPGAPPLGVWRRSESLHLALLRARIPAFRATNVEVTGAGGGPVQSEHRIVFVRPAPPTDA